MCGIAGIVDRTLLAEELAARLHRMMAAQVHRGPDEAGEKIFPEVGVALGCRRLSLVDIDHGQQPVANEDESVFVVFNGEIYNHNELRHGLQEKGHRLRSRTDTEVIVHLYEDHGLECLEKLDGMFGLAIYDTHSRKLILARDRIGIKPLYYTAQQNRLLFASEIKALLATDLVEAVPDLQAVNTALSFGWVPAPRTGFNRIEKLPPGGYLVHEKGRVQPNSFFDLCFGPELKSRDDHEYPEELEGHLRAAVKTHLAADVPVGCFISGGWDSSLLATIAAEQVSGPLKTFSIVFPENPDTNEARYSRLLASHLGSDHQEIEFRVNQFPELLTTTTRNLEEPATAAPAVLIHQLTSLASTSVKAVLSGEGADELFGGYAFLQARNHYRLRRIVPQSIGRALSGHAMSPRWRRLFRILAATNNAAADAEWYRRLTRMEKEQVLAARLQFEANDGQEVLVPPQLLASSKDVLERRLGLELTGRLPECLTLESDKLGMARSLEVRVPFLDRNIIDFSLNLPSRMKIQRNQEKYVLSFLAKRLLPPEIASRKKQGLGFPRSTYHSESMINFSREILLDSVGAEGPINRDVVESLMARWAAGEEQARRLIVPIVHLQVWWNQFFR